MSEADTAVLCTCLGLVQDQPRYQWAVACNWVAAHLRQESTGSCTCVQDLCKKPLSTPNWAFVSWSNAFGVRPRGKLVTAGLSFPVLHAQVYTSGHGVAPALYEITQV